MSTKTFSWFGQNNATAEETLAFAQNLIDIVNKSKQNQLVFEIAPVELERKLNWNDAIEYCESIGWRLPTKDELKQISQIQVKTVFNFKLSYFLILVMTLFLFEVKDSKAMDLKIRTGKDSVMDIDGNIYWVIVIGDQVWMKENLKTTRFNDGVRIPNVKDNEEWGSSRKPAYCFFDNDSMVNREIYGALYNWYSVETGKLCPVGWHIPSDKEWTTLHKYLSEPVNGKGLNPRSGGKMKEKGVRHWLSPNTGADNSSGFSALPAGTRGGGNGTFRLIGRYAGWWSTTQVLSTNALFRTISFASDEFNQDFGYLESTGFSVRCIKDK